MPTIWTQCGGTSNVRRLSARAWRVVEAQHVISTRRLVDSGEEQELLEDLIDARKPPRRDVGPRELHYLLFTPFRYPPLRHGSRFATRQERSLWYGSRSLRTAFAESAYYRLVFLAGTTARLDPISADLTAFRARVGTRHGLDLTIAPFDRHRPSISSPTSYAHAQDLGRAMRAANVEAVRYHSARDVRGGVNLALFSPTALTSSTPDAFESWHGVTAPGAVEYTRRDYLERRRLVFPRDDFEIDGELPAPAP